MTNATISTRTTVEHLFEVPTGSAYSDMDVATHWAKTKAKELGIDTSFDDWCTVESNEERTSLVITETRVAGDRQVAPTPPPGDDYENRKSATYEDLLDSLYPYINWKDVTRRLTTPQRELFADAVDAVRLRSEDAGGPEFSAVERWWQN